LTRDFAGVFGDVLGRKAGLFAGPGSHYGNRALFVAGQCVRMRSFSGTAAAVYGAWVDGLGAGDLAGCEVVGVAQLVGGDDDGSGAADDEVVAVDGS